MQRENGSLQTKTVQVPLVDPVTDPELLTMTRAVKEYDLESGATTKLTSQSTSLSADSQPPRFNLLILTLEGLSDLSLSRPLRTAVVASLGRGASSLASSNESSSNKPLQGRTRRKRHFLSRLQQLGGDRGTCLRKAMQPIPASTRI